MDTNYPDCVILTEEELAEVTAGTGSLIGSIIQICNKMGVSVTPATVSDLILKGSCAMRDWAKSRTNNNPLCNLIPCF